VHKLTILNFLFRWVKFEEDVEEGGNRWSKPHVATLSLHSLFELRSLLMNGTVCLDMAASSLDEIADLTLDTMINSGSLPADRKDQVKTAVYEERCFSKFPLFQVKAAMLKKHRHQFEGIKKQSGENGSGSNMSKLPIIRSLADIGKNHSSTKSE
jgi:sodium bicarbonate transporter 10